MPFFTLVLESLPNVKITRNSWACHLWILGALAYRTKNYFKAYNKFYFISIKICNLAINHYDYPLERFNFYWTHFFVNFKDIQWSRIFTTLDVNFGEFGAEFRFFNSIWGRVTCGGTNRKPTERPAAHEYIEKYLLDTVHMILGVHIHIAMELNCIVRGLRKREWARKRENREKDREGVRLTFLFNWLVHPIWWMIWRDVLRAPRRFLFFIFLLLSPTTTFAHSQIRSINSHPYALRSVAATSELSNQLTQDFV